MVVHREHPFAALDRITAAVGSDPIIVGVSCGKDSVVTLDLIRSRFPASQVCGVYWYVTPGLSFHEQYLTMLEARYGVTIHRRPHWILARLLRDGVLRQIDTRTGAIPRLGPKDIESAICADLNLPGAWFAFGEKVTDNLTRRKMITNCQCVDAANRRVYPVGYWSHAAILAWLRRIKVPLSPEYRVLDRSYGGTLDYSQISVIKQHWPEDYERIRQRFPRIDAEILRAQIAGES